MSKPNLLLSRIRGAASLFLAALFITATTAIGVQAMSSSSSNTGSSTSSPVQPYAGGAPISKVLYPADGSTVTITCTGAVIKQSPGGTPYREGWISPSNIGSISVSSDLKGQIASGSTNPYGSGNICPTNQNNSQSNQSTANNQQATANQTSSTTTQQNNRPNTVVITAPAPQTTTSSSSSANATANASATLTGSGGGAQAPAQNSATPATTSASPAPVSSTQSSGTFTGKSASLPNTGPGSVLIFSGLATVLGTIGHFIFQRFRYNSL